MLLQVLQVVSNIVLGDGLERNDNFLVQGFAVLQLLENFVGRLCLTCCVLQNGLAHIAVVYCLEAVVRAVNTGNEDLARVGQQARALEGLDSAQRSGRLRIQLR